MPVKAGVIRAAARNTRRGAAETFTGVVFQDPVITAEAPSRLGGSVVTFTPGARTAWHSHPVGQTLFCLSGVGRICFKGEKPQVLNPGDTVNIPPDTMHWHGASPIGCSRIWRSRKPASRVKAPLGARTSAT
jgi:quercetin dioxygenase-like cupin family protein